jgi:two-component system, NarL family, nitrate/nitrite response regulator NarL
LSLRCLIVDDNERFLEVARASLGDPGLEIVATATTSEEAFRSVEEHQPDVVLIDIGLGAESGFDLARTLTDTFPRLVSSVVLISTRSEDDYAEMIEGSPAAGFITKAKLSPRAIRELVSPGA